MAVVYCRQGGLGERTSKKQASKREPESLAWGRASKHGTYAPTNLAMLCHAMPCNAPALSVHAMIHGERPQEIPWSMDLHSPSARVHLGSQI